MFTSAKIFLGSLTCRNTFICTLSNLFLTKQKESWDSLSESYQWIPCGMKVKSFCWAL